MWTQYAQNSKNMQENMQKYVINVHLHAISRLKYVKYVKICKNM